MELTVELSQNKWPPEEQLPALFKANLPAMLAFPLAAAFSGLRWASFPSSLPPFPVACSLHQQPASFPSSLLHFPVTCSHSQQPAPLPSSLLPLPAACSLSQYPAALSLEAVAF